MIVMDFMAQALLMTVLFTGLIGFFSSCLDPELDMSDW
jgi:hypothetical protein